MMGRKGRKENSLAVSRVEKDKIGTPLKVRSTPKTQSYTRDFRFIELRINEMRHGR